MFASSGRMWLFHYPLKKNGLSYRKITHLSIKTQEETQAAILDFLQGIHVLRKEEKIPPELILNFDETAIFYNIIPNYTYELEGTRHSVLKT